MKWLTTLFKKDYENNKYKQEYLEHAKDYKYSLNSSFKDTSKHVSKTLPFTREEFEFYLRYISVIMSFRMSTSKFEFESKDYHYTGMGNPVTIFRDEDSTDVRLQQEIIAYMLGSYEFPNKDKYEKQLQKLSFPLLEEFREQQNHKRDDFSSAFGDIFADSLFSNDYSYSPWGYSETRLTYSVRILNRANITFHGIDFVDVLQELYQNNQPPAYYILNRYYGLHLPYDEKHTNQWVLDSVFSPNKFVGSHRTISQFMQLNHKAKELIDMSVKHNLYVREHSLKRYKVFSDNLAIVFDTYSINRIDFLPIVYNLLSSEYFENVYQLVNVMCGDDFQTKTFDEQTFLIKQYQTKLFQPSEQSLLSENLLDSLIK